MGARLSVKMVLYGEKVFFLCAKTISTKQLCFFECLSVKKKNNDIFRLF